MKEEVWEDGELLLVLDELGQVVSHVLGVDLPEMMMIIIIIVVVVIVGVCGAY
jgi:hypothetical protein